MSIVNIFLLLVVLLSVVKSSHLFWGGSSWNPWSSITTITPIGPTRVVGRIYLQTQLSSTNYQYPITPLSNLHHYLLSQERLFQKYSIYNAFADASIAQYHPLQLTITSINNKELTSWPIINIPIQIYYQDIRNQVNIKTPLQFILWSMLRRFFNLARIPFRCTNKPPPPNKFQTPKPDPNSLKQDLDRESKLNQNQNPETQQQQSRDSTTTFYLLSGSIMVIGLAYFYMQMQIVKSKKGDLKQRNKTTYSVGKAAIGGDWKLIDTNGNQFGSDSLKGKYYLIYFGFCNCPDICPNSMMKMRKAVQIIKKLPESSFFKLASVFVSVDPDRDSLQDIKKFTSYFDKDMIGVTGTYNNDPQLKQCMKKFKIYASKIDYQEDTPQGQSIKAYTIDHTIITYLMNDQGEYLTHLGSNLSDTDLAKEILSSIQQHQKSKFKKRI